METPRIPGLYFVALPDEDPTEWVLHVNQMWYASEAMDCHVPMHERDKGITWQDRWPPGTWFSKIS